MRIAYYRVSTGDQSIESQRHVLGGSFDREFSDEGISGGTIAASRPGFAKLLEQVRRGDTVFVSAIDRLGRDALDVQTTVRRLLEAGVLLDVHGLGQIGRGVGELILAVLAQVADMERQRIRDRTEAGRATARASLAAKGKTHNDKTSLGRSKLLDAHAVASWRAANKKSIKDTAAHFKLSDATVKRYCAEAKRAQEGFDDPLARISPEEMAAFKAKTGGG
jgi:putative DNA-invertase from lambdoid prophage Rac